MRGARATLIAILLVGTAMTATASDMVLTRNGELYRIAHLEDGLAVSHRLTDGTVNEYLIPQTAGIAATSVQVGVDELTGAVVVMWQEGEDIDSRIELAWLVDSFWSGPFVIAGGDGSAAANPQLTLDRVVSLVEEEEETIEVATTFLHLAWWSFFDSPDDGAAYLASIPLNELLNPAFDAIEPVALQDLLPFGVGCEGIENAEGLSHPKLFVDPQSGAPLVFAPDFSNCVFQILKLDYELVEELIGDTKRRRHIVLLGRESMIAINPNMVLSSARVEVGHGLDVVMYWDVEGAVAYTHLDENGIPPVKSLPVGQDLSREQAIDVIRSVVH